MLLKLWNILKEKRTMQDDYKLSDEMHKKVLSTIESGLFHNKHASRHPQIYILGGQPAAGKGTLTSRIFSENPDESFVSVNGDEYRLSHPAAQEIFNKHDKDFAAYTDPDVRVWTSEIFADAIKHRYNIIFEGTMRTNQICRTIENLQQQGYGINIMVMAVPEIKSRISIYSRYQEQLDRYPIARFTPKQSHDAAYTGMLSTLQEIEDKHLYDTIAVYNREGDCLFKTGDKGIVSAIEKERNKPLPTGEKIELNDVCNDLLKKMYSRGEKQEFIDDIKGLQKQLFASSAGNMDFIQNNFEKIQKMKSQNKDSGPKYIDNSNSR